MNIDNSKYSLFQTNQEKYRLTYGAEHPSGNKSGGISPIKTSAPLADGSAMHFYIEAWNKKLTPEEIKRREKEEGIPAPNLAMGKALAQSFINRYDGDANFKIHTDVSGVFAEREFSIQIPGSPHFLIGKIDELVEHDGKLWVGDYKSANNKATENKKKIEFNTSSQPNFYLNALKLMGHTDIAGMLYRVVTKHTPPQHYVIPVKRGPTQLDIALYNIHQVAEQIQMMINTFGVNEPWPHNGSTYPCNYADASGASVCEYSHLCGRSTKDLTEHDFELFKPRESHLICDR